MRVPFQKGTSYIVLDRIEEFTERIEILIASFIFVTFH